jgi:hypothetical protein
MKTRKLCAWTTAALVLGTASSAWALDAWRDRRGLYFGAQVGAGSGQSDADGAESQIGFNLRARVGGGINKQLTLDAELGWRTASYDQGPRDISESLFTGLVGGSFFIYDGLYVRAQGGVGQLTLDADPGGDDGYTGFGFGAGVGYEFFATADLAVGVGGDYQLFSFDDFNFTTINFGVTATWY